MTVATNVHTLDGLCDFTMSNDFEHWWTIGGEWVEEPNERRNGWSGMMRVRDHYSLFYVKRQFNHQCRTWRHPLGWPTTSREWHYLHRLKRLGLAAPEPVFHATRKVSGGTEAVLVTRDLRNFAALDTQNDLTSQQRLSLAETLGRELAKLHRARLQHSCLYDKHIMVRWDQQSPVIALIDLEKMRSRTSAARAADHDLEQLKRRQHLFSAEEWGALTRTHQHHLAA